jgi:N-acetylglucosamine-6-phosphate deacetylase
MKIEGLFYIDSAPVSIEIENDIITQVTRKASLDDVSFSNVYVGPGLIDNQVNGYVTVDFTGEGLTVEGIHKATRALWKKGVTTYLPTLITQSQERLIRNFSIMSEAVKDRETGITIPGYHLEGPYISPEHGYRGFHRKDYIRPPDWQEFMKLNEAAGKRIIQVSLAPEIEGALEFIDRLKKEGIVVALAHHNASSEIIRQAIDKGAVVSTHLGNGCANMIHRHNNPLWQQLADDRMIASLIVDGFHLRKEEVQVFYKIKGPERIILTSDVMNFAGMEPGEYTEDDRTVVLTPDGMLKYPEDDCLAGAASPLVKGVGNMMRFTDCSLADAIHMSSRNPAKLYGLKDRGEILPGKRADLILYTMGNHVLTIKKTILAGKVVYEEK